MDAQEQELVSNAADDLLTTIEAATLLQIHPDHLRRLKREGKITTASAKLGPHGNRYRRMDVEALKAHVRPPVAPATPDGADLSDLVSAKEAASLVGTTTVELG